MQHFFIGRIIVKRCGPIDLVAASCGQLTCAQIEMPDFDGQEDMMTLKFPVAKIFAAKNVVALLAAVAVMAIGLATQANAQTRTYDNRGRPYYGPTGPNSSYQSGPRTRVYVTKRSWLDAGVEVLPGDRKFTDYAYPPGTSFGQQNLNRPLDRSPFNPPSDLGGYPRGFPLY